MIMMTTFRTLVIFEGLDTQRRYKGSGGEVVTKRFNYCEVFSNHFFAATKLTTKTIIFVIIFIWRRLGQKNIGLTVSMINSWRLHRSIRITCGGTWLIGWKSSLGWNFGVSWDENTLDE